VARLLPDGQLEQTFAATVGGGDVLAVAQQPDGRLVVGGRFVSVNGEARGHIVRLRDDGGIDAGFNATTDGTVRAVAVLADGRLLIAGGFGSVNDEDRAGIARLLADGSVDPAFVVDPVGEI